MHLFYALIASLIYVVAAMLLKQVASLGVGVWRMGFLVNVATGLGFLILLPLGGEFPGIRHLYEPVVTAVLFVSGVLFTLLALDRGDVSVATPILGVKIILVALFAVAVGAEELSLSIWIAAGLASLGIACLHLRLGSPGDHHNTGITIVYALGAAVSFALFDVLIAHWSSRWGTGLFLPITMMIYGLLSFAFIPLFRQPLSAIARPVWRVIGLAVLFMVIQALILVSTLATYGKATELNIIFSLRGLWSIAAVWLIGHWFANREREHGAGVMIPRVIGALFLSAAVLLVLV